MNNILHNNLIRFDKKYYIENSNIKNKKFECLKKILAYNIQNPTIEKPLFYLKGRIAVIGAGIAGTIASLYLARLGVHVDLFEKEEKIFMGSSAIPAHLYSGVQYFDDISMKSIRNCTS